MTLETILQETFHWIENNLVLAFVLLMGIVYYLCSQTTLFSKSEQVNVDQNHKGSINLVLVYAPWCGHSKKMIPDYDRVIDDYHGGTMNGYKLNILKYDSDVDKEEVKKRGVKSFPSLFIERDGNSESFPHRTYEKIVNGLENISNQ